MASFTTTDHAAVVRTYTEAGTLPDGRRVFRDMSQALEEPAVIVVGHQTTKKGFRSILRKDVTKLDADGVTPRTCGLQIQPLFDPKIVTAAMMRQAFSELYSLLDSEAEWNQFLQGWFFV